MKYINFFAGLLIAGGCFFVLFQKTDFHVITRVIYSSNVFYLLVSLGFIVLSLCVKSIRWHMLLAYFHGFNLSNVFTSFALGNMVNMLLPFRSGDLVRVFSLSKKERVSKASILGTVVYEHMLDFLALSFLFCTAILTYNFSISKWIKFPVFLLVFVCTVFLIFTFIFKKQIKRLENWANQPERDFSRLPYRIIRYLVNYVLLNLSLFFSYKEYLKLFSCTLLIWIINGCWLYFLFLSLDPSFKYFFGVGEVSALLLALTLAVMLPSAPSYAGTLHLATFLILRPTDLPHELILSYAIMIHGTGTIVAIIVGCISWLSTLKIKNPLIVLRRQIGEP